MISLDNAIPCRRKENEFSEVIDNEITGSLGTCRASHGHPQRYIDAYCFA
jgi:hypothetical protein